MTVNVNVIPIPTKDVRCSFVFLSIIYCVFSSGSVVSHEVSCSAETHHYQ